MTTPHSTHGLYDLPRLEVVPGVPYAEKPVAGGTPFEQDRLCGHTPVLSDGPCRSELFATRLAVTFGHQHAFVLKWAHEQKTAAGVVREAAKVLRLQVPYWPEFIPSSFGRRP